MILEPGKVSTYLFFVSGRNTGSREQVDPSLVILKNRRLEPACAMNHKLLEVSFGVTDTQQDFPHDFPDLSRDMKASC